MALQKLFSGDGAKHSGDIWHRCAPWRSRIFRPEVL